MPSITLPRRPHRRALAATAVAALACSTAVFATAAPASATVKGCNSTTGTWVHLYPSPGAAASYCVGNLGVSIPPNNITQVFCAGNNYGDVTYEDLSENGVIATHTFWSGGSYAVQGGTYKQEPVSGPLDSIAIQRVQILGSTGGSTC